MPAPLTFRRDLGGPLSAEQFDGNTDNIADHETRIATLEGTIPVGVESVSAVGNQMTFVMTDASTRGPITLPVVEENDRGEWAPFTHYAVNDTFGINGMFIRTIFDHTSAATFDLFANDGLGHDFYKLRFSAPSNALPEGGEFGQVLFKLSSDNYDQGWRFLDAVHVTFSPSSSSALTSGNVADTLEELEALIASSVGAIVVHAIDVTYEPSSASGLISTNVEAAIEELAGRATDFSELTGTIAANQCDPAVTALGTTGIVSLDPVLGNIFTITPTGNVTLNAASAPAGAKVVIHVTTSGTSSFSITPNTNFKSQGVLATGTVSGKTFSISFDGNGANLVEACRTAAM